MPALTLRLLWDLNIKVGHSVRSTPAHRRWPRRTTRSARRSWKRAGCGAIKQVFDLAVARFRKDVVAGTAAEFVAAKLAERDARHIRMGESRYVVEPNVKDGKGGLRDLHTLYWIGK